METVLRQGLTMLTWSSVTLESFFQEADQVLYMFKQFFKKVYILSLYKWNDNSIISSMPLFILETNLCLFLYHLKYIEISFAF